MEQPAAQSPRGGGSLRYLDYARKGEDLYLCYEHATAGGSHELRMNRVEGFFSRGRSGGG